MATDFSKLIGDLHDNAILTDSVSDDTILIVNNKRQITAVAAIISALYKNTNGSFSKCKKRLPSEVREQSSTNRQQINAGKKHTLKNVPAQDFNCFT